MTNKQSWEGLYDQNIAPLTESTADIKQFIKFVLASKSEQMERDLDKISYIITTDGGFGLKGHIKLVKYDDVLEILKK